MKLQSKILISSLLIATCLAVGMNASAEFKKDVEIPNFGLATWQEEAPRSIVEQGLNWFFIIAGILCIVIIVWAGITYATAGGDEEKVSKAKTRLIYGIIGVVVIIAAFAITQFIKSTIGGDVPEAPSL